MSELEENLKNIQANIQQEKSTCPFLKNPIVVAVSKKQPISKIEKLYHLGVHDFGENYLQEALEKIEIFKGLDIHWHFIGALQSKKIKEVVRHFQWIHTVSRFSEIEKIAKVAKELGKNPNVLIQVNLAGESSKQGISPDELEEMIKVSLAFPSVKLRGLMFFPPLSDLEEESLYWFAKGKELFDRFQPEGGSSFDSLSMGTSSDYHLAYRSGATHLRIGESLMGLRSTAP